MRSDKAARHGRFCDMIRKTIDDDGQEKDGYLWAVRPLADWADMLGVDKKTVERLCAVAPIQALRTRVGGVSAILLRIEAPGGDNALERKRLRDLARVMEQVFFTKTGHKLKPADFGGLNGLAEVWPDGFQIEIFKHVLADWDSFMSGAKLRSDVDQEVNGIPDPLKALFYKFPIIWPMRKYHMVAADAYLMHLQGRPGGCPNLPFPYQIKDY